MIEPSLPNLLHRIAQRDVEAMEEFYQLTQNQVLRGLRRILRDPGLIEEASQDVYRHVWLRASTCNTQKYSVLAWLRTITQSRAIDTIRAHRRQRTVLQPDWWETTLVSPHQTPEQLLAHSRLTQHLDGLITSLNHEQSHLLRLAFYEGYSHHQISEITGKPLGTIKSRIRAALQLLRQSLNATPRVLDGHELVLL
jgi:RNA polymerase sigma-70 factor, ECF subfamily